MATAIHGLVAEQHRPQSKSRVDVRLRKTLDVLWGAVLPTLYKYRILWYYSAMQQFLLLAGSIIHLSQLIEHNLRLIIFLDARLDQKNRKLRKDELVAEDLLNAIQKETLGKLIDIAQDFGVFGKEDLKYLRSITPQRNLIAHQFFKDGYLNKRFGNYAEEQKMLNGLRKTESEFDFLHNSIIKIIADYESKGARE